MRSLKTISIAAAATWIMLLSAPPVEAEDVVELLNGTNLTGTILEIRKETREFDFESSFGTKQIKRTYSYDNVHAVTFGGKRFVFTPMTNEKADSDSEKRKGRGEQRTKAEVLQIIEDIGSRPPDWLASTTMDHPNTLDLDWPLKASGNWDESKNVGQYLWGRVSPNVSRWKPGVKLVYECMNRHQDDPALLRRDQEKLGEMYFTLFQDYPRAAYWLQKANATVEKQTGVFLAECYWRLGNPAMALAKLRGSKRNLSAIKLLGDIGEIDQAMKLADVYAKTNLSNEAFLKAGDALRGAGRLDDAIQYYQKVLDQNKARNEEYLARYKGLAQGAIEAIELFDKSNLNRVADGIYSASTMGYNGQVEVQVDVKNARIEDIRITRHQEKQFYAALTDTPKQIIDHQGLQDVDGTSGATITSQAIINSTARALSQGAK